MGALSKLEDFLLNSQVRTVSGTIPGTFGNVDVENQEPSGDRCQNDTHPQVEFAGCRASSLTDSPRRDLSQQSRLLERRLSSSEVDRRIDAIVAPLATELETLI